MKKWIFSIALIFSINVSHQLPQEMTDQNQVTPKSFAPSEDEYLSPQSVDSTHLSVKAMKVTGFSGDSLNKLESAMRLLEAVVNTDEFKERVLNFKNSRGQRSFASNKGLTNEQIYEIFMSGKEILQPNTPYEMNFYLNLYNRPWSKVIGYTSPNTNTININWKYFRNYLPSDVAANLAHEWTHKIGFDHKSAKEHDSAPYAIGYIIDDISKKLLKTNGLY